MSDKCLVQTLKGSVTDIRMGGFLQVADFSKALVGINYENGKYWADNYEEKRVSPTRVAIDPVSISNVRNGLCISVKDDTYKIVKLSVKKNGNYYTNDVNLLYIDEEDLIFLYITIARVDDQLITDPITPSDIVEIKSQYPTFWPWINNPIIEAYAFYNSQGESPEFHTIPIGGYFVLNYAHATHPYELVRKNSAGSISDRIDALQTKTVKYNNKYYRLIEGVWTEVSL